MADDERDPVHVPPDSVHSSRYRVHIDSLMSSIHGEQYTRTQAYRKSELNAVTPNDVLRWMNTKVFGMPDPPLDANPVSARSSSLQFYKKSISFFMPNRLAAWSYTRNEGNPTRSTEINDLIKRVKRKEVRKQGVAPKCRRAIMESEFRVLHRVLTTNRNECSLSTTNPILKPFGLPALLNFQFHLIARIDDTTQVLLSNLRAHDSFPTNVLKTRLNWSKNVHEERDAPWQMVLGCMDTVYCVLVSIALFLELNLSQNPSAMLSPYLFCFCNDVTVPGGGQKTKEIVQNVLGQQIFKQAEFVGHVAANDDGDHRHDNEAKESAGFLGSHSIRKYAATHARRCGCTKDEKDIRGRWKNRARTSDVYDDVELPYPDAKVANKLCIGGPCFYLLHGEQSHNNGGSIPNEEDAAANLTMMTKTFILSNVVPNVRTRLSESCSYVLGKALLWYIFAPNNTVPQEFADRIKVELKEILRACGVQNVDEADFNPVMKVPVIVSGDEGTVFIEVVEEVARGEFMRGVSGGAGVATAGGAGIREQLLALQSGISQLRRDVQDVKQNQGVDRTTVMKQLAIMNANLKRIGNQPMRMLAAADTATQREENLNLLAGVVVGRGVLHEPAVACLSSTPRNLYELWREYLHGIGGRKPACEFSRVEKGRVKHKYHRRKIVWDLIQNLVHLGFTAETAIDRIHLIYGSQTSVTEIINQIKKHKKDGTLSPNLRPLAR